MGLPGFVDLCSDDEIEEKDTTYAPNNTMLEQCQAIDQSFGVYEDLYGLANSNLLTELSGLYADILSPTSVSKSSVPICSQFWKAGDYEPNLPSAPKCESGQNRLRVHPKFLHSNATSHKWAFGAVAELLDNALDEVQHGATFVTVDKTIDIRNGRSALLIQDDGGGMDPESLRQCMSFGFSDKNSDSSIGQYGNGFKTSTMRLGADVIVFTRCTDTKKRKSTQSVGLLSYTFLRKNGYDDIVVPMVDYDYDPSSGLWKKLLRSGQNQYYANMSTLLRWSPFGTEDELLKQFADIGPHGTKVIIFNLWLNDAGQVELDFDSDAEDIMINGGSKLFCDINANMLGPNHVVNKLKALTKNHVASKLRYSLRVYSSILYLHLPETFKVILRGRVVDPHYLVNDLKFRECIKYTPRVGMDIGPPVITSIGFLEGAPHLNVHGFNVYHRNRLILPFWPVVNSKGKGVAGVLEVNFIKPTHDKQDLEKSDLFQKLELRLRQMTVEYWNLHCHLVGYQSKKVSPAANPSFRSGRNTAPISMEQDREEDSPHQSAESMVGSTEIAQIFSASPYTSPIANSSRAELSNKRRHEAHDLIRSSKKPALSEMIDPLGSNPMKQVERQPKGAKIREMITMIRENKKLKTECLELERAEEELKAKEKELRNELEKYRREYEGLSAELRSLGVAKIEKL